jgi:hypothetical protein
MNQEIAESPLADVVVVPTHVILHRGSATPRALAEIRETAAYRPGSEGAVCELHAGGSLVALGKLVRRTGSWYLQIAETGGES